MLLSALQPESNIQISLSNTYILEFKMDPFIHFQFFSDNVKFNPIQNRIPSLFIRFCMSLCKWNRRNEYWIHLSIAGLHSSIHPLKPSSSITSSQSLSWHPIGVNYSLLVIFLFHSFIHPNIYVYILYSLNNIYFVYMSI